MAKLDIYGLYAATSENLEDFKEIWMQDHTDPELLKAFIEKHPESKLVRIGADDKPYQPNKKEPVVLKVWEHPKHRGDADYMVGLFLEVERDSENKIVTKPQSLIVGPKASMLAIYRMSCCGGFSTVQAAQIDGETTYTITDDKRNTHDGQRQLFNDKVRLDDSGVLAHAAMHILGHNHDCSAHAKIEAPNPK